MLLSYGGVKNEYFMDLVRNALEDAQRIHYNKRAALRGSFLYYYQIFLYCVLMSFHLLDHTSDNLESNMNQPPTKLYVTF